jgi:tricorn protease
MRSFVLCLIFVFVALFTPATAYADAPAYMRRPDVFGDKVVFTAQGDLWLGSIQAGTAQRLTSHPGNETFAHFSPDGTQIAFLGNYDGGNDVYVMPTTGGLPKRLTYDTGIARPLGWTPDGKSVLFRSRRNNPENRNRLFTVPATGGIPTLLPIPYAEFAQFSPDGKQIAYVPVSAEWQNWWRYEGGQADDVWLADLGKKEFKKLTDFKGIDTSPVWVEGKLFFVSERDGQANLTQLDPASKKTMAGTKYTDYAVRYPATDGKKIVFEHGNGIALFDPNSNQAKELKFELVGDRIHARPRRIAIANWWQNATIGPSGKRVAVDVRGGILTLPVDDGDARTVLPMTGFRSKYPTYSPDGKQLAFISDKSGDEEIWICDAVSGGSPRQLTRDHVGPLLRPVWSPDGKWIAFSDREQRIMIVDTTSGATTTIDQADRGQSYDRINQSYNFSPDSKWLTFQQIAKNWFNVVMLYEIGTQKKTQLTESSYESISPVFDPSGKYLWFISDRNFDPVMNNINNLAGFDKTSKLFCFALGKDTPSPFALKVDDEGQAKKDEPKPDAQPVTQIDLEGLADRLIEAPAPPNRYQRILPADGKLVIITNQPQQNDDDTNMVVTFDIKSKQVATIAPSARTAELSGDRKKLLVLNGQSLTVADAATGFAGGKALDLSVQMEIDPTAEWKQMYSEAWRLERDLFYDPNLHGADWKAVKAKYEGLLPLLGSRDDLSQLMKDVIAELNAGHAYITGGDLGTTPSGTPQLMGYLGADFEAVPGSPAYKITKLYAGDRSSEAARSPLLEPGLGVKVGHYLLAVNGRPASPDLDVQALMIGTLGKVTSLLVNDKPTTDGARTIWVKPLPSEAAARYQEWVLQKRAYVKAALGPEAGYVHMPDMTFGGLVEFNKQYFPQVSDHLMVMDVRNNGGGFISGIALLQIASQPESYSKPRFGASWSRQNWGFIGHRVALCNENSGSDAEWFSDMFKRMKLGPVIGARTWGGLVGSGGGYPLLDGGRVFVPNYGAWFPDSGWVAEGPGFKPDVEVEQDPAALLAGKDPQLDKAIQYLKDKMKSDPVKTPMPPAFPVKTPKKP